MTAFTKLLKMTNQIVKDIGEIYSRLFDCRPFLNGEVKYFVREFEEKRQDREIEGLFVSLQNTIELRDSSLERCRILADTHLAELKHSLEVTRSLVEQPTTEQTQQKADWIVQLNENRNRREQIWQQFKDDMTHKCSRVDNTFEEKEEELREFYSDLERKLHIHN